MKTVPASIILGGAIIAGAILYQIPVEKYSPTSQTAQASGSVLPVVWGNLGRELVRTGVIDGDKFSGLYISRGEFSPEYEKLLLDESNGNLKITKENAGYLLNLLWAFGLGNKNPILEEGEMMDPRYGGPQNFASTGGWTMSRGEAMNHYSAHTFFELSENEQKKVSRVAKNIYRPCCSNSAHFPDCNHGMAMLGLLELMASQGVSEKEMHQAALLVNSYWFPGYQQQQETGGGCSV